MRKTEVKKLNRFAISVFHNSRIRHILINRKEDGKWFIRQHFSKLSMIDLIQGHIDNKEPVQPEGTMLIKAVPRPDYYILHDNVEIKERLGTGNFGDVHLGILKKAKGGSKKVAVKKLKLQTGKKGRGEFVKEAQIVRHFHHPNIVQVKKHLCEFQNNNAYCF